MTSQTKPKKYRLQAKQLFLTYPKCPVPPSVALKLLEDILKPDVDYSLCVQEKHQDGTLHLHCVIVMKKKLRTSNPHFADLSVAGTTYHGSYEGCRGLRASIEYLFKTGNKVEGCRCDPKKLLESLQKKTGAKHAQVAHMILVENKTVEEINQLYPGYVLQNLRKIQNYHSWLENIKMMDTPKKPFNLTHQWNREDPSREWELKIVKWINTNFTTKRTHRQPQLWIHGPTATGKTHLILNLLEYFHGYNVPNDGKWLDGYCDKYDFCYFDEFKGSKTIQFMNGFVEGSHYPLPRRGQQPYIKKKNLPTIVLSNYSISGVYSKADPIVVAALKTRFLEVEVPGHERIEIMFEYDESDEDTCPLMSEEDSEEEQQEPQSQDSEEEEGQSDWSKWRTVPQLYYPPGS
jgi:hypothetical protein